MATDIEPKGSSILKEDARTINGKYLIKTTYCITNPPWDREILHPIIGKLYRHPGKKKVLATIWMLDLDAHL